MKKTILGLLIFLSMSAMAQKPNTDTKLDALRNEKNQSTLQHKINNLENGNAEDLDLLIRYYAKDAKKKDAISKKLLRKYPDSQNAVMLRLTSFLKLSEPQMEALLQTMIKSYPGVNLDREKYVVANGYAAIDNVQKATAINNTMKDPVFRLNSLIDIIQALADLKNPAALEICDKELGKAKAFKNQTAHVGFFKLIPKNTYYNFIDVYAKLLFNAGRDAEAYKYTTEAYNNKKDKDQELIDNYALLSSMNGKYQKSLPVLAKGVKDGKSDPRYLEQVRIGYAKLNPGKDVDAYVATLQEEFKAKIRATVEKKMINETPPDFYVKDVNGNKVTLADFKGKTIVLDFWATWCGPCVASFPAMQMAVNRYKNDPDVKFLFIHTCEHVADPLTDAKTFLAKRGYTNFSLYMDMIDPVLKKCPALEAFKIDGIPMKYVIDPQGKIRFEISGFAGSGEATAEEVSQMIELARKGS